MTNTDKLSDEQWLIQHLEDDAEACSAVNGSKDITTKDARRAEVTVKRLIRERDDARRASQAATAPSEPDAYLNIRGDKVRVVLAKFVNHEAVGTLDSGWSLVPLYRAPAPSDGLREALQAVYDWQAGSHVMPTELWVQVRAALSAATQKERHPLTDRQLRDQITGGDR